MLANATELRLATVARWSLTHEPVGAAAVVRADGVAARAPVEARTRPAVVPVGLAVDTRVAIDAVAPVRAVGIRAV